MAVEITSAQLHALAQELQHGGTVVLVQGGDGGKVVARTNISEDSDHIYTLTEDGREGEARVDDVMEVEAAARDRSLEPLANIQDEFIKSVFGGKGMKA